MKEIINEVLLAQKNILYLDDLQEKIVKKLCWHSARLYNSCLYNIRQYFFANGVYLPFKEQYYQIKENENYSILQCDSAQQVLRIADKNFHSFFSLKKLKEKGKYSPDVNIPRYLDKEKGWSFFFAGRSVRVKDDKIYIGLTKKFRELYDIPCRDLVLPLPKNVDGEIHQLQIKPMHNETQYQLIVVYEREEQIQDSLVENRYLSIDCGVSNLLTCYDSYNKKSFIIDGRYLKSVNQFYNKEKAKIQSKCDEYRTDYTVSKRFIRLSDRRTNVINEHFNHIVKYLVDYCLENGIKTIVIGDFKDSKQGVNLGDANNQNFVCIPFYKLKLKLKAKCEFYGIAYVLQDESYSSKASALDLDDVPNFSEKADKKFVFSGKRVKRGLYRSKDGILINADLNGAINILRKYLKGSSNGDLSLDEVRAASTSHPYRVNL